MTDQLPPNAPSAKSPEGASAASRPSSDTQPGSGSSPYSPPPGEYRAPSAPPAHGAALAYGPPYGAGPPSPEASRVRTQAIVWTIINGISILVCFNYLFGLIGLLFGVLGITRSSIDVATARKSVRTSWIMFVIGIILTIMVFAFMIFVVLAVQDGGQQGNNQDPNCWPAVMCGLPGTAGN